ncbi:MAG: site-specific integrase [Sulfuricurvum sp.]|nr:site-specific integrase [Sulfuricurvum sp.]
MTFDHYANLYLKFKEKELKNSTFEKYQSIIDLRLLPFFKDTPINEIKVSDIKLWLLNIDDVGGKSKRIYLSVIKGIFDEAFYDEVIEKNPVSKIRLPKLTRPTIHPFTPDEVKNILLAAEMNNYKNYLNIAFFTGMRSGEIIGLKKEDIDLKNKILKVRRTRSRFGETSPKTRGSLRDIPILDSLFPLVETLYNLHDHDYLFKTQYNEPYRDTNVFVDRYWKPSLEALNLEYRRPYNTRHTYATNMLYRNLVTPVELAQLLGHSSTEMVFNIYVAYLDQNYKTFDRTIDLYK